MMDVFSEFPHDYEFDENGVLRRSPRPHCVKCGKLMNKNGHSYDKLMIKSSEDKNAGMWFNIDSFFGKF